MIYILAILAFIICLYVSVIFSETIAIKYPEINFSKWWRRNIIQHDENNYYN